MPSPQLEILGLGEVRWSTKNSFLHVEVCGSSPKRRPRSLSDGTMLRSLCDYDSDSTHAGDAGDAASSSSDRATEPLCDTAREALLSVARPRETVQPAPRTWAQVAARVEPAVMPTAAAAHVEPVRTGLAVAQAPPVDCPAPNDGKNGKKRREVPAALDHERTLMLRNIPNKYTPSALLEAFAAYRSGINFFYLPIDFKNKCNLGYAFLNFSSTEVADRFASDLNESKLPQYEKSEKVLLVQPARVQGLAANVKRFRNSSVMGVLPEEYKPMIFDNGVQRPFPMPGKKLPPVGPRFRPTV